MRIIENISELIENSEYLDKCLSEEHTTDRFIFACERIKKGNCFLTIIHEEEFKFYPSRFIGYCENSKENHDMYIRGDGKRETNPAIDKILGKRILPSSVKNREQYNKLESEYLKYCERLDITPKKISRKYWTYFIEESPTPPIRVPKPAMIGLPKPKL